MLLVAVLLAATIGFVNQFGGTCMVAAVSDLISRKPSRIIALAEAGLWAFVLGAGMKLAGFPVPPLADFPVTWVTVAGGLLLGLGAWLNQACLFGTLTQLSRRNANYLFTPAGLFAGFLIHAAVFGNPAHGTRTYQPGRALVLVATLMFAISVFSYVLSIARQRHPGAWQSLKFGHREAVIIHALAFTLMASIAGAWTYGELLSRYAHGSGAPDWNHELLLFALVLGALAGGARNAKSDPLLLKKAALCFAGGALMALGSGLVPGRNDLLILYGVPLLQPHAIVALAVMVSTTAICLIGQEKLASRRRKVSASDE